MNDEDLKNVLVVILGIIIVGYGIFVIVLLRSNFKMPKEESDGSALGALLAPSAGLFAGLQLQQSLRDDETTSGPFWYLKNENIPQTTKNSL